VDMFLAICYREASPSKLAEFQEEMKTEGKVNEEMGTILESLAKPNYEIKSEEPAVKKKSTHAWYDISRDNGKPQYKFKDGTWVPLFKKRNSDDVSSSSSTATTTTTTSTATTATITNPTASSSSFSKQSRGMVVVGDAGVGKTTVVSLFGSMIALNPLPTVISQPLSSDVTLDGGVEYSVSLVDTVSSESFARIRSISYKSADAALILFSVDNRISFNNAKKYWADEVKHFMPNAPIILVGMKADLRENSKDAVSLQEGNAAAVEIGAQMYTECVQCNLPTSDSNAIKPIIKDALLAVLREEGRKKKKTCNIM